MKSAARLVLRARRMALLCLLALGTSALGAQEPQSVTAFVAASTQDALRDAAAAFTKQTGIAVKLSPGASNALATQIINGAGADLFLSANEQWADEVAKANLAAKSVPLISNSLVVVVPRGNPAGIKQTADLQTDRLKHLALAGEKVPAGMYAQQALSADGVLDDLSRRKKIVRGQDVRATLAFVERGEAEAGVVYASDTLASDKVETAFAFDPARHDKIVYPLVLLSHGRDNPAAARFFEFLSSAEAQKMFEKRGFRLLAE